MTQNPHPQPTPSAPLAAPPSPGGSGVLAVLARLTDAQKLAAAIAAVALLAALFAVAVPALTKSSCDRLEDLDARLVTMSRDEEDDHAQEYSDLLAQCLQEQADNL